MAGKKNINGFPFISYARECYDGKMMKIRCKDFYKWMDERRTCRDFSNRHIPKEVIENIILTASTAPSGAHKQPWTFCVVSNP
jgi:hypothetical protein